MAQTPRNPLAMTEFGRALTKLQKQKPGTAKQIERWALRVHGLEVDPETIRKAHKGEVDPTKCSANVLVALKSWYGCEPDALGRFAASKLQPILSALVGGGPDRYPPWDSNPEPADYRGRPALALVA